MAYTGKPYRRHGSFCKACALNGRRQVPAMTPPEGAEHAKIVLLGEAPAAAEEARGEPFIGPSGSLLTAALSRAGLRRDRLWITNAASCRFTEDSVDRKDSKDALASCAQGLRNELKAAWDAGYRVLVPMGQTALGACGLQGRIGKWRGSVVEVPEEACLPAFKIVPTFHPAAIPRWSGSGRGTADPFLTLVADLEKAKAVAEGTWTVPAEHFNLDPSFHELKAWCEWAIEAKPELGCDIESDGLSRFSSEAVVIGFAWTESDAISVPLRLRSRDDFIWSDQEWAVLKPLLDNVFETCTFIFQNAAFDAPFLRYKGFKLPTAQIAHDTYLLHSDVAPEEEHNLGYITSQFGSTAYWKDIFKDRPGTIYEMEPLEMRRYNLRDSVVLKQITPRLVQKAKELGVYEEYREVTMPLFRGAVMEMQETGVPFDYERLGAFAEMLQDLIDAREEKMRALVSVPPEFELRNSGHLAWLLYGWEPGWVKDVAPELEKRQGQVDKLRSELTLLRTQMSGTKMTPKGRAKREAQLEASVARHEGTKVLAELLVKKRLVDGVHPLWVPPSWDPPATEKGGVSTDKEALLSLQIKLQNDLAERDERAEKHEATLKALALAGKEASPLALRTQGLLNVAEDEASRIGRVLDFLAEMKDLAEFVKLKEAFTKYKAAPDGRIHPWWNAGGAATGRLSCLATGTPILTAQGEVPIEAVAEGDWVLSHTGCWRKVRQRLYQGTKACLKLTGNNFQDIICTNDHRFLTPDGWKRADALRPGMEVYSVHLATSPQGQGVLCSDSVPLHGTGETGSSHNRCKSAPLSGPDRSSAQAGTPRRSLAGRAFATLGAFTLGRKVIPVGETRSRTPELEGGCVRQQRTLHDESGEKEVLLPSHRDGEDAWNTCECVACKTDRAPHRWRPFKQLRGQPCSMHRCRTQEFAPKVGTITTIARVGTLPTYDLTVEVDHSYVSANLISHNCSGPNLMQIPHGDEKKPQDPANEIRRFLRAEFGQVLVSGDFENAEVLLFGCETEDSIILDAYYQKKNIHDINTATLFQLTKNDALWNAGRMAAKKMQFGRYQYGSGLRTMYRKILLECPGLKLTYSALEDADQRWWAAHPGAKAWDERMTAFALEHRVVFNEFGRARIFLGNAGDVPRAAKNFRIQSACASIINRATLRMLARRDREAPDARMVMQVHDQVIFMAPATQAPAMARIVREELERPFLYLGIERTLRAGMEWGPSYGEFVDLEGPIPDVIPEDRVETPERRAAWKKGEATKHLKELVA